MNYIQKSNKANQNRTHHNSKTPNQNHWSSKCRWRWWFRSWSCSRSRRTHIHCIIAWRSTRGRPWLWWRWYSSWRMVRHVPYCQNNYDKLLSLLAATVISTNEEKRARMFKLKFRVAICKRLYWICDVAFVVIVFPYYQNWIRFFVILENCDKKMILIILVKQVSKK